MRSGGLFFFGISLSAALLISGGCSPFFGSGTQKATQFYMLSSLQSEAARTAPLADLSAVAVSIGPVSLPLYLDRLDVVTRDSQNSIAIAQFSQWAGPLQENFSRVLAENVSLLLNTNKVDIFPISRSSKIDYNVIVYITRFDGYPGGTVELRSRWAILDGRRKNSLFEHQSAVNQKVEANSIEAMVAAESTAVAALSREIAQAIIEIAAKVPPKN